MNTQALTPPKFQAVHAAADLQAKLAAAWQAGFAACTQTAEFLEDECGS